MMKSRCVESVDVGHTIGETSGEEVPVGLGNIVSEKKSLLGLHGRGMESRLHISNWTLLNAKFLMDSREGEPQSSSNSSSTPSRFG